VAHILGVTPLTIRRWLAAYRQGGDAGLAAKPTPRPHPRLTAEQQAQVLSWLSEDPRHFGFSTELWTAPRVAVLIERTFGVHYHPRYLNAWLKARGITPQKPRRRSREREESQIRQWRQEDWPRIKKKGPRPEGVAGLYR
jgi:transposase